MAPYVPRAARTLGFVALALLSLAVALNAEHNEQDSWTVLIQDDPNTAHTAHLKDELHSLEGKLASAEERTDRIKSGVADADLLMHSTSESSGLEKPFSIPPPGKRGHEWTAEHQEDYDNEMKRALGETDTPQGTMSLPTGFLPIEDEGEQEQYAQSLVKVLRGMKSGYWDELLDWATNAAGSQEENPYISPIVEAIEAPLVQELDTEAHKKVSQAVKEMALKHNLSASEMSNMRSRLLVPLLLRIRARVHKKVETYTVSEIRRVILDGAKASGEDAGINTEDVLAPSVGEKHKPTKDERLEYTLRDIDALYEKGAISERDYQAQKAKVLSEWLGDAIHKIGGKQKARRALEDFLWPPTYTESGCRCLLPFLYVAPKLGEHAIEYEACTDITSPGTAWCAVDPEDKECGKNSADPRAHMGDGGYGWTHWDKCKEQPKAPPPEGALLDYYPRIETQLGCRCKMPFEVYPPGQGGRRKMILGHCTRDYYQDADWCATEGDCGHAGTPTGTSDERLTWTHWDRCIGEPAGFLEPPKPPIKTKNGCTCLHMWKYEPADIHPKGDTITYNGCADVDSPGAAWCAVKGEGCGTQSTDPHAGYGEGEYGWSFWDECVDQPTKLMKNLERHVLPVPVPYVRTQHGCSCKLPYKLGDDIERYRCTRHGGFAPWCPVNEDDCGYKTVHDTKGMGLDWTHFDVCIGEPAGFLPPAREPIMTEGGCVCRLVFKYQPASIGEDVTYTECTDIGSPNQSWCAIDEHQSPPGCKAHRSRDPRANEADGGYGWTQWDHCKVQPKPLERGVVPAEFPAVKTLQGCDCKLPYHIKPPGTGLDLLETTCNRYSPEEPGLEPYYWCPTAGEECGHKTDGTWGEGFTHWDKCIGQPAGFLEPAPEITEGGCECLLPFIFTPKSLEGTDVERITYTQCTDTGLVTGKSAWCAVRGSCGKKSHNPDAHMGADGFGWTHWDFCKKQPEVRPALPTGQPELPEKIPEVRTQHGCRCTFPFEYAPADTCDITDQTEEECDKKKGYMLDGWCVKCTIKQYTECIRVDEDGPWCPVEGDACGKESSDYYAGKAKAEGGYGWTHWDHCVGEPAGFLEPRPRAKESGSASSLHGVTVESMIKKREYEGRNGGKSRGRDEIHKLERQMATSIHTLNSKIQQLQVNTTENAAGSSARASAGLGFAAVVLAALIQMLYY